MIKGEIEVNGVKFGREIVIDHMSEEEQEREVNMYVEGMKLSILTELRIGDYK